MLSLCAGESNLARADDAPLVRRAAGVEESAPDECVGRAPISGASTASASTDPFGPWSPRPMANSPPAGAPADRGAVTLSAALGPGEPVRGDARLRLFAPAARGRSE
jgi:hypothetical protein